MIQPQWFDTSHKRESRQRDHRLICCVCRLMADGCVAVQQNGRRGSVQHQPGPSACHLALARRSLGNDRERMASVGRSWEVITDWNPCRNNTSGSMSQNVEDYTLIPASIPDLYPSELHISLETKNPWLHPALSDPDVLCWEAQRKFICNFGSGKGAALIHQDNLWGESAMAALYFQCWVTLSWLMCYSPLLHHCSHIPPKPHYWWSMLLLSQFERNDLLERDIFSADFRANATTVLNWESLHWSCGRWPIMTTSNRRLHCLIINIWPPQSPI